MVIGRGAYLGNAAEHVYLRMEVVDQILGLLESVAPGAHEEQWRELRERLVDSLPPVTAESIACSIPNLNAGRVTNRLDLMGGSFTVDAACASGLVALDQVMRSLRERRSDVGVAAAV
ncbi:MAG TPA: beta-ketoacyl synthase N-terminal-like domain-containing protein, partial [Thermoanaerobaculia bacterium]|nr:beta-ketoacyl synthase N-terminal-like domain-containing protein [Thermoanaerobaculia bacterium]